LKSSIKTASLLGNIKKHFQDFPGDDKKVDLLIKREILDIVEECEDQAIPTPKKSSSKDHLKKLSDAKKL
jgi:hypothetical protein